MLITIAVMVRDRAALLAICLCSAGLATTVFADARPGGTPIAEHAIAILDVPGYPDFMVGDGETAWIGNEDRVERYTQGVGAAPVARRRDGMYNKRAPSRCILYIMIAVWLRLPGCASMVH